jgi:hypothetical protein
MLHWIKDNPQWIGIFCYTILEHYLGSSKKVSSNSLIALIWNIIRRRKL